jgi:16S rRNA processing protein RimM
VEPSSRPGPDSAQYLDVGRIVAPFGLAGELRVMPLTDFPERFAEMKTVLVGESHRRYRVLGARATRGQVLLKLRGVNDVNAAEALRGELLRVPLSEAMELGEGEYFWYQIIDAEVVTTAGQALGKVADIIKTGANDVYVVRGSRGEVLIPAIEDVVREVDVDAGRIVVELIPGLVDDVT